MIEFVTIGGTAVRVTECRLRTVEQPDGTPLAEVDLIVILRGQSAHETFLALLERPPILLDIPPDGLSLKMTVSGANWVHSGGAYRHELTLREISASDAESRQLAEPAGIDAVLRLEALIEALDRAGVVSRSVVDDAYRRLLAARSVAETAARRATRDVVSDE